MIFVEAVQQQHPSPVVILMPHVLGSHASVMRV